MITTPRILLAAVLAMVAAGCSDIEKSSAPTMKHTLAGWHWTVISIKGKPVALTPDMRPAYLEFDGKDAVTGFTGVNRLRSTYTTDGSTLKLTGALTTKMASVPAAMDHEAAFLDAFNKVDRYHFDGPKLVLAGSEGDLLTFAPSVMPSPQPK